jgi:hypothetical protein
MARVPVMVVFVGRWRRGGGDIEAKICRDAGSRIRREDRYPTEQVFGQRECRSPAFAIFLKSLMYEQQV